MKNHQLMLISDPKGTRMRDEKVEWLNGHRIMLLRVGERQHVADMIYTLIKNKFNKDTL